jgi:3-deoxy-manno-octulosonate cytidylyltransferase (CMP-KDO synthetase)
MIQGKSMIQRVYEQCQKARFLSQVVVATDDKRIYDHVKGFGGEVVMTATGHQSGTDRIGEVADIFPHYTHYINIQGDEPFINPEQIDLLGNEMLTNDQVEIITLIKPLKGLNKINDPNIVKVVCDLAGYALYFSRSPIPFPRQEIEARYFKHIGIYGFRKDILLQVPKMKSAMVEKSESLEQLRWLANGYKIRTLVTHQESISVDRPEDLKGFL